MSVIAFPLGDGCPDSGRLVDADATDGAGLIWCATCGRWALTEPSSTDGKVRQIERHRTRRAVRVATTAPASGTPIRVDLPRDGHLTRSEAEDLRRQLTGVLAAGHPLDHNFAHPVDALEPF